MTKTQKTDFLAKLMIGKKNGGTISKWFIVDNGIYGCLVESISDSYPKGKPIQTSPFVAMHNINNEQIAETNNSYYRLIDESSIREFYSRKENQNG